MLVCAHGVGVNPWALDNTYQIADDPYTWTSLYIRGTLLSASSFMVCGEAEVRRFLSTAFINGNVSGN